MPGQYPGGAGKGGEESVLESGCWPVCQSCDKGNLLPLSDFGGQGAAIHYKAWVCSNPSCGFNIKIRNGEVYVNEPMLPGTQHVPRQR
jgi:hypothetical protein